MPYARAGHKDLCPVRALRAYLEAAGIQRGPCWWTPKVVMTSSLRVVMGEGMRGLEVGIAVT